MALFFGLVDFMPKLNISLILNTLGVLSFILGISMVIPLLLSFYYGESDLAPLALSLACAFGLGIVLYLCFPREDIKQFRSREALLLVTLAWVLATILGAFPFYFSGHFPSLLDAWFESASGFTTTGASVLTDIESLPHGLLLWRSLIQFLGGMGIVVLSLAILPLLGVGGMDLYKAEVPGPTTDKISARVSETARILWVVYVALASVQAVLLVFSGLSPFDAINHALTTMATGGFSTKNQSVASFANPQAEAIIAIFMFFAGINFLLLYRLFVKQQISVLKDRELRFFLVLVSVSILLITATLWGDAYSSFSESFRYASFQVISIASSTGFGTGDFVLWAPFAQVLLLLLMVVGGSAGSTAGGIKCIRAMMLIKQGYRELYQMVHPKAVLPLRLGDQGISPKISSAIFGYFFLYVLLLAVTTLLVCACGVDFVTSFSGTISALSNIGPGLGEVGPALNYSSLPAVAKFLLASCMIIGRLEIFTVLVILTPGFWRS